jgi:cytochrome c oxidase subunit 2
VKNVTGILLFLGVLFGASAENASPRLPRVDFAQRLGQRLPLETLFRDETGAMVPLGRFFEERPVLLVMAYYECPNLCTVVLNGLLEGVRNLRAEAGRDFQIVVISINPGDSPRLAQEKKQTYTLRYGRPGTQHGWHFLTGASADIAHVSAAAGFHYEYDPTSRQFAHPSGLVVLTPSGIISRYFFGIEFPAAELSDALTKAAAQKIAPPTTSYFLFCFHYDPRTGRYSLAIARALQAAGIGAVVALGILIALLSRRRKATASPAPVLAFIPLLPERASDFANSVDAIFYALLAVCGLIAVGVFAAAVYFCVRYRSGARRVDVAPSRNTVAIETTWTCLSLVTFLAIFVWAAVVYVRMAQPPANATEIQVVARQWMWKAQHAGGRREINELHLEVNQPVRLTMTSQDVIHDFFIPAFRTKQDVLPGRYTTEWFTPTRPGKYHLFCAEYCGTEHSLMGGWIHVLEPAEYARWQAAEPAAESTVAIGARLFVARGCTGCHSAATLVHAPPLENIYGQSVPLADGSMVVADDQYLHDSILLPNKQIAAGYPAVMPSYQGQLSEEEVFALVAYIRSLTTGGAR